ncbi:hypothetical protein ASPWEDRAFT_175216 [Aspergillus wentii DTO 134E9]|uniref:Uncharacterized protein n=1 Tax=Aspergillus wentii DTO 134E9 TaxID=1073089 RepID=A0A1L9RAE7_ASPWE|nr:uncharacterized protein ASPWEDRAFT_175216 [Aspergillus wentii DTO 134E9]KAI9934487.1 hypothetical protein MW887_000101 [Aspergillus wentii]OJJ31896.1 hypothetical protein ASPWEDRAFT_175216 [Aspergillus wentii DTO 134E9]
MPPKTERKFGNCSTKAHNGSQTSDHEDVFIPTEKPSPIQTSFPQNPAERQQQDLLGVGSKAESTWSAWYKA